MLLCRTAAERCSALEVRGASKNQKNMTRRGQVITSEYTGKISHSKLKLLHFSSLEQRRLEASHATLPSWFTHMRPWDLWSLQGWKGEWEAVKGQDKVFFDYYLTLISTRFENMSCQNLFQFKHFWPLPLFFLVRST